MVLGVGGRLGLSFCVIDDGLCHQGVQAVSDAVGGELSLNILSDQREIADHVEDFVSRTFVVEPKPILNRSVFAKDQDFVIADVEAEALFSQQVGFGFEQERSGSGDLVLEGWGADDQAALLFADRGLPVVQLVVDFEAAGATRLALNPAFFVSDSDNRIDLNRWSGEGLFCPIGVEQDVDELLAGAIATRHFGSIDSDFAVVDLQSGQCGQDVLDHFDRVPLMDQGGPSGPFGSVADRRFDPRLLREVGANEDDSVVRGGGSEFDIDGLPAPIAPAGDSGGSLNRRLLSYKGGTQGRSFKKPGGGGQYEFGQRLDELGGFDALRTCMIRSMMIDVMSLPSR